MEVETNDDVGAQAKNEDEGLNEGFHEVEKIGQFVQRLLP